MSHCDWNRKVKHRAIPRLKKTWHGVVTDLFFHTELLRSVKNTKAGLVSTKDIVKIRKNKLPKDYF